MLLKRFSYEELQGVRYLESVPLKGYTECAIEEGVLLNEIFRKGFEGCNTAGEIY